MCTCKVYVRDYLGRNRFGGYFPCGRCHSCRQQSANRRAVRIRSHRPDGYTCYFVTLDYSDRFVPYIRKSDLVAEIASSKYYGSSSLYLPVYRNYDWYKNPRTRHLEKLEDPKIDEIETGFYYDKTDPNTLPTLCVAYNGGTRAFDSDRIGICYMPDLQKFLKRLRSKIDRYFGENVPISYYATFEYGSTYLRPHLHLAVWAPNAYFTETSLRRFIFTAWSYSDRYQENLCVISRSCAKYIASYVNCSSIVPKFLQDEFPPKHSHSLGIGFDQDGFGLSSILDKFKMGTYEYHYTAVDKYGRTYEYDLPLPSYVLYRYFPRIKGFSRLSRDTLYYTLGNLEKVKIIDWPHPVVTCRNGNYSCILEYASTIRDVYGNPVMFKDGEFEMFRRRFIRTYLTYYLPLSISYIDYVYTVVDFLISLDLHRYKMQFNDRGNAGTLFAYDNLQQVADDLIDAPTVYDYLAVLPTLDCNYFPDNYRRTKELERQFELNIKQRNINQIESL